MFGPLEEKDNAKEIPDITDDNGNGIPADYWLVENPAGTITTTETMLMENFPGSAEEAAEEKEDCLEDLHHSCTIML